MNPNDVQDLWRGAASTPYVGGPVTAHVDIVNQPVAISFDGTTYTTAAWTGTSINNGDGTYTRTARLLVTVDTTFTQPGFYPVLVKVTATPEIPVIQIGAVRVH
jgi:hypothetical protein